MMIACAMADDADYATMHRVCEACAGLAEPPVEGASSLWSTVHQRLFGGAANDDELIRSMSVGCYSAVSRSCTRFRAASEETDPEKAMKVMAVLTRFSYCRGWLANHPKEVSISQLTKLVEWRDRACGLRDEL